MAAPAAVAASGAVSGTVFYDYDGEGDFDTGNLPTTGIANDRVAAGILVTAYDAAGNSVGSATTTNTGSVNYSISLDSAVSVGDPLRIEFTKIPTGYADTFFPTEGGESGTSVQFVSAGAENVDLGLFSPNEYNTGNTALAMSMILPGTPGESLQGSEPAISAIPWTAPINYPAWLGPGYEDGSPDHASRKTYATFDEVGSVDTGVFNPVNGSLYAAATYKRGAGLKEDASGPKLGAIYEVPKAMDPATGALLEGDSVTEWVDVVTLGIDIGQGDIQTNAARGLGNGTTAGADINAFKNAGKVGIGGVAVDAAGKTLYFVNLKDEKVYGIDIATKSLLKTSWATPAASRDTQRPYALLIRNQELYVGYVDTSDSSGKPFTAMSNEQKAYVAKALLDDAGGVGSFDVVLEAPLGYAKGDPLDGWWTGFDSHPETIPLRDTYPQIVRWNSWTDVWTDGTDAVAFEPSNPAAGYGTTPWPYGTQTYPQAMLTSIAIDSDGYLTLGLRDRTTTQGGVYQDPALEHPVKKNEAGVFYKYEAVSSGDILLAAPTADGRYELESNGEVGTRAASTKAYNPSNGTNPERNPQVPTVGEGPGGREFYDDAMYLDLRPTKDNRHHEIGLGGVLSLPGVSEVAASAYDPWSRVYVQGVAWYRSTDGTAIRAYEQNAAGSSFGLKQGEILGFGKGGALNLLSTMTRAAPIEIGNRTWLDADQDGIQDADEPAINGVTVSLYAADAAGKPTGSKLADTTTATLNGEPGSYIFSSAKTERLEPNKNYVVVFTYPTTADEVALGGAGADNPDYEGLTWNRLSITKPKQGDSRLIDSNPNPETGQAPVSLGDPGRNDHTIDAGFIFRTPKVTIEKGDSADGQSITHDADTASESQNYEPGETRTIVLEVTNTGDEDLREVVLVDDTLAGDAIVSLVWTMPDGTKTEAVKNADGKFEARWEATFGKGDARWAPGAVITGVASLTIDPEQLPHLNSVLVRARGAGSGILVTDEDPYYAVTSGIQVIKYDGELPDPKVKGSDGAWVAPGKPLVDSAQDANTTDKAVKYVAGEPQKVRWVVTNIGNTWLTNMTLVDSTSVGPKIGADWTADLSAFGGPSAYSFVEEGPWSGLLPPGASFFAQGSLTIEAGTHTDTVTVTGQPIAPAVDEKGVPTGKPMLDENGNPVLLTGDDGEPITLTDDDPFNAIVMMPDTGGGTIGLAAVVIGAVLLAGGGVLMLLRRRRQEA
ncbi:MAG: SdrD B-like domain-containing protein [Microbacterium sp.]|uniref:SdrD B-like domain-containing protein n=1 Tax=Microbacterium sp. TaxID=51671 RepID=UPI003A83F1BF